MLVSIIDEINISPNLLFQCFIPKPHDLLVIALTIKRLRLVLQVALPAHLKIDHQLTEIGPPVLRVEVQHLLTEIVGTGEIAIL